MKKIIYPEKKDWMEILRRPVLNTDTLRNTVKEVLDKVKTEGDKAVREYEERFDKVKLALHGFLHCFGFDHIEQADEEEMTKTADEIMKESGIERV